MAELTSFSHARVDRSHRQLAGGQRVPHRARARDHEPSHRERARQLEQQVALDFTHTPLGPFMVGDPAVAGTIVVSGTWSATVDGTSVAGTISTPSPLIVTPSCDYGLITRGTVNASYETSTGTRTVNVVFSGCAPLIDGGRTRHRRARTRHDPAVGGAMAPWHATVTTRDRDRSARHTA